MELGEMFEVSVLAGLVAIYFVVAVLLFGHAFKRMLKHRVHKAHALGARLLVDTALLSPPTQTAAGPNIGPLASRYGKST